MEVTCKARGAFCAHPVDLNVDVPHSRIGTLVAAASVSAVPEDVGGFPNFKHIGEAISLGVGTHRGTQGDFEVVEGNCPAGCSCVRGADIQVDTSISGGSHP